jgi:hypothetical protein
MKCFESLFQSGQVRLPLAQTAVDIRGKLLANLTRIASAARSFGF